MDSQRPSYVTEPLVSVSGKDLVARYHFVDSRHPHRKIFPLKNAGPFDRLDIFSDAAIVDEVTEKWRARSVETSSMEAGESLDDPPFIPGSTVSATQASSTTTSLRIRCAAYLHYRGLDAILLCEYDEANSIASNFILVEGNEAFEESKGPRFKIGHLGLSMLRSHTNDDANGRKLLGVLFGYEGDRVELLGKKVAKSQTKTALREEEKSKLHYDTWGASAMY